MKGAISGSRMLKKAFSAMFKKRWKHVEYLSGLAAYSGYRDRNFGDIPCFESRAELHKFVSAELVGGGGAIDYLEFGVFKGETISHWTHINSNLESRFMGFDTFEGLPEDWENLFNHLRRGDFSTEGITPDVADSRVKFVKGLFQDTLRTFLATFEPRNRLVIHCDADLYSATLYVLATLDHMIKSDTIVLFDELDAVTHEFRALNDYQSAFGRALKPVGYAGPFFNHVAMVVAK